MKIPTKAATRPASAQSTVAAATGERSFILTLAHRLILAAAAEKQALAILDARMDQSDSYGIENELWLDRFDLTNACVAMASSEPAATLIEAHVHLALLLRQGPRQGEQGESYPHDRIVNRALWSMHHALEASGVSLAKYGLSGLLNGFRHNDPWLPASDARRLAPECRAPRPKDERAAATTETA